MPVPRHEILKQLDKTLRTVGVQSVLLSDTVAKLVGLNSTDLECLDLLDIAGPTTAGRLAQHAGLTTGAMTAVIDRLESVGFVRRVRDPQDRRCVRVEALRRNFKHVTALYQRLIDSTARLHEGYDDKQLAFVVDYLTKALALAADHVAWLQTQRPIRTPARQQRRRRKRQAQALLPAGAPGNDGSLRGRP
jgi:DNA-binding MarR family transcriptional regulator